MKRVLIIVLVLILIVPSVMAQEEYSGVERLTDNVGLLFSGEENKVNVALEIREKEVNSAIANQINGEDDDAIKNLERAQVKLELIQENILLDNVDDVKDSVTGIKNTIETEGLDAEFANYIYQEEKTGLTADLTEKTFEYCKQLAQENYNAMLEQEECNPETASKGIKKGIEGLTEEEEQEFWEMMRDIRSCIDDPGTCNCEANLDTSQKAKCEKMVALALKCEYTDDESACSELKSMEPVAGDNFAESFVPEFLMDLFKENQEMIDYNIEKSDGVPPECWNENTKPECRQYDYLKEGYGRDENEESVPTIQESIPQCFDEENNFLEEKCGEITIVWNEEGLINYLIGNELQNIIDEFENASEQNTIDINLTEDIGVTEIEIDGIKYMIVERTFAPGTEGFGEPGKDIQTVYIEDGDSNDYYGLEEPVVDTGMGSGDDGLSPVVVTDSGSGGSNNVEASNTIDEGSSDSGSNDGGGDTGSGDSGSSDGGGVDDGPGEPGVVDED